MINEWREKLAKRICNHEIANMTREITAPRNQEFVLVVDLMQFMEEAFASFSNCIYCITTLMQKKKNTQEKSRSHEIN